MSQSIKEKIRKLYQLGDNPRLALFQMLQEFEQKAEMTIKEATLRAKSDLQGEIERFRGDATTQIEKAIKESFLPNITSIKGEKGDSPKKGSDYFTESELKDFTQQVFSMIRVPEDGVDGKDGESIIGPPGPSGKSIRGERGPEGIPGRDAVISKSLINEIADKAKKMIDFKPLEKKIEELAEMIREMKALKGKEGKTMHRGGMSLEWEELTLNASGSSATLSATPYDSNSVMIFYNGTLMTKTTNYTLSGRSLIFLQPIADSYAWALYRKS